MPSFITVRATLTDGSFKYVNLGTVPASATYAPAAVAFLPPADAAAVTVFHGLSQNGFLQIDDAALAALPAVEVVIGVPNGDFEQADFPGATTLAAWQPSAWGANTATRSDFSWHAD